MILMHQRDISLELLLQWLSFKLHLASLNVCTVPLVNMNIGYGFHNEHSHPDQH